MINVFENSTTEHSTFSKRSDISRIATFGIIDEKGQEQLFFSLDSPHEKYYYYAIPEKKMDDGKLMKRVKKDVKNRAETCVKAYYSIISTAYDSEYRYWLAYSRNVQNIEKKT